MLATSSFTFLIKKRKFLSGRCHRQLTCYKLGCNLQATHWLSLCHKIYSLLQLDINVAVNNFFWRNENISARMIAVCQTNSIHACGDILPLFNETGLHSYCTSKSWTACASYWKQLSSWQSVTNNIGITVEEDIVFVCIITKLHQRETFWMLLLNLK